MVKLQPSKLAMRVRFPLPAPASRLPAALLLAFLAIALTGKATAQNTAPPLCSDRPGLNTPPCVVGKGTVQVELGFADWTLDRSAERRTDSFVFGDALLRYGLTPNIELRAGWQAFLTERTRDRTSGMVDRQSGVGDVTLSAKVNLAADGSGPIAVLPYVTLPTAGNGLGAGTWETGLLVPISIDASDTVSLLATPQIAAAADADGSGRHVAWGTSAGIGLALTDRIAGSLETQFVRDEDPTGTRTQAVAGAFLGYQPDADSQFDIGAQFGLNADSPDVEMYFGVTRRF